MEVIRSFFNKIRALFQSIGTQLSTFINRVAYKLTSLVTGKNRADAYFHSYRSKKRSIRDWWHDKVDVNAPYYRPVVIIWKTFFYGFIAFAVYIFSVETNFLWLMGSMPSVEDLQNPKVAQSSEIYTSDGVMIGKFYTENRTPVTAKMISPNLVKALIATEDVRFYKHSGIDYKAMASVAVGIVTGATDRGGGSTITQQLAKKLFKTRKTGARGILGYVPGFGTLIYKTKEWLTAIKLERNFTKEEILTMYFNTVDYGNNTYGINTAAQSYFSKSPDSLNIQESAVLVGLQKATTTYNPIRNMKRSLERRNVVINQMQKYGYISAKEADSISALPIELKTKFETPYDGNANYFKNAVVDFVKKWGDENGYDLYTDGLKIYTTIDSRMQEAAEEAMVQKMKQLQRVFEDHWRNQNPWRDEQGKEITDFLDNVVKRTSKYKSLAAKFPNQPDSIKYYLNKKDTMTVYDWKNSGEMKKYWSSMDSLDYYKRVLRAGMMAMNPQTGQIKAWVGGLDYNYFKYDAVKQGKRQPGSTFKPFVYTTAIDDSSFNMSPCDQIVDKPFEKIYMEDGEQKEWRPRNATGTFSYSNMTLRRALAQSINSVTAELTDQVGPANVARYAKKMGITTPLKALPSIGLGPFDVSLYDMVAAYGVFVNNGTYTQPILVTKIEDSNGKVIEEFQPEHRQAISEESAFLMVQMLKGGVEEPGGTSGSIRWKFDVTRNGNELGGKTGTTSNNSDGWFMCITRDLVVGAWVGGDDRSIHFRSTDLGEGAKTALPIVGSFLEKIYRNKSLALEPGPFPKPSFKVSKNYNCPTQWAPAEADSLGIGGDSTPAKRNEEDDFLIGPPPIPLDTGGRN
ncbi:transglycosylase domain-containing protein [Dyadobacter chenwenxiniae]|uniref:Transglycosylase domain-containing protein n=1 Tax=Dyadobacter chenwenxiniae TaxID=2906456 RepID=A0A9X1PIT5_9BACT|nr:transglycosylase domain-containing protein [Dyadobacter chenwenxiniae]MCF0053817.1 transglycosylase domain-containing protein [Dyadobacter chenwenxiniae]MCF0061130.1 transglycosylase domain-containing protein [Dyadobacter chenwenxiniae]UON80957.1 transglycosylase domain-containing protein [Dyadobacter chenwenxiniae]